MMTMSKKWKPDYGCQLCKDWAGEVNRIRLERDDLLRKAFQAGMDYAIGGSRHCTQTHLGFDEWLEITGGER